MTKTNIAPGREFNFGSLPCIVLEAFEDDTVLVLAKESIGDYAFDEDNCNNFNKSSLRKVLNDDFLETLEEDGADLDSMLDFTIDLTSDDGLKDYGESTNRVALLTCDICTASTEALSPTSTVGGGLLPHTVPRVMDMPTMLALSTRTVVCSSAMLTMVTLAFAPLFFLNLLSLNLVIPTWRLSLRGEDRGSEGVRW